MVCLSRKYKSNIHLKGETAKLKVKYINTMVGLFNDKIERKINIRILSLTKKYTKELEMFCFSVYNWCEITKVKVKTDELLNELRFLLNYCIMPSLDEPMNQN